MKEKKTCMNCNNKHCPVFNNEEDRKKDWNEVYVLDSVFECIEHSEWKRAKKNA